MNFDGKGSQKHAPAKLLNIDGARTPGLKHRKLELGCF